MPHAHSPAPSPHLFTKPPLHHTTSTMPAGSIAAIGTRWGLVGDQQQQLLTLAAQLERGQLSACEVRCVLWRVDPAAASRGSVTPAGRHPASTGCPRGCSTHQLANGTRRRGASCARSCCGQSSRLSCTSSCLQPCTPAGSSSRGSGRRRRCGCPTRSRCRPPMWLASWPRFRWVGVGWLVGWQQPMNGARPGTCSSCLLTCTQHT